ncbi:MAG: zinc-binding dehydrogenase [Acidilobus sp.]
MRFKAAVLKEFRAPFSVEEVELAPTEDEVPVRVLATGVCGRDVVVWLGGFRNLRPPLILGHEVVGVTEDGQMVAVYPGLVSPECAASSSENLCPEFAILGEGRPGGYAEYVFVPRWNLIKLPGGPPEAYASAACGVATIIHASRLVGVKRGDRVLVTGATGGVGIHGVQYLVNVVGARVYGLARSQEKAKVLAELGVTPVTDLGFYKSMGKVDFVFEIVGAPTINDSLLSLRPGGTLVLVGNVTGEEITLRRPALVVMRELKITGTAAYTKAEFEEALRLIGEGVVKPFYRVYGLDEINKAYQDILDGKVIGRAVIKP